MGSNWGTTPDWYRNIEASAALKVETGRDVYRPVQHFLSPAEVREVWAKFKRTHPIEEQIALTLYTKGQPGTQVLERRGALRC